MSSTNQQQFDVSKPVFDLFALRSIRGDALLRYNTLNQSEPLRINLYALLAVILFSTPLISESVGGEPINAVQSVASVAGGLGSLGLFVRECQKRSKQLSRIEKELNAENLPIRIPANVLADMAFEKPQTLRQLKQSTSPPRIIAVSGTGSQLKETLGHLAIFGRRLRQSSAYVVPVPLDGSTRADWGLSRDNLAWLCDAYNLDEWKAYFDELAEATDGEFRWFGLNSNGRSFGSGSGESPQWLQVLGQHLRPTELPDESDSNVVNIDSSVASVLDAQNAFYAALTSGNIDAIQNIFSTEDSEQVSQVVNAGGRIDDWNACLADGARPEGMAVSGGDALVVSDTEAYSTVVEFPANTGIETATLLAVQKWRRDSKSDDWKLLLHQTIPWSTETRAQGTLRCDCRGCVALTRGPERRTFGGLIG